MPTPANIHLYAVQGIDGGLAGLTLRPYPALYWIRCLRLLDLRNVYFAPDLVTISPDRLPLGKD